MLAPSYIEMRLMYNRDAFFTRNATTAYCQYLHWVIQVPVSLRLLFTAPSFCGAPNHDENVQGLDVPPCGI